MKIKPSNKIIIIFTIAVIIIGIIFFPILPQILNYPPDSINNEFQKNIDLGILYTEQYILIIFLCFLIGLIAIKISTKKLDKIEEKNLVNLIQKILRQLVIFLIYHIRYI